MFLKKSSCLTKLDFTIKTNNFKTLLQTSSKIANYHNNKTSTDLVFCVTDGPSVRGLLHGRRPADRTASQRARPSGHAGGLRRFHQGLLQVQVRTWYVCCVKVS